MCGDATGIGFAPDALNPRGAGADISFAGTHARSQTRTGLPDRRGQSMNLFVLRTWLQAKFANDERGASMVEYILLVALIALAVIAAVVFLRDQVSSKFNDAGSKISTNG
jgi:Flp pilus assembly pilin Flp